MVLSIELYFFKLPIAYILQSCPLLEHQRQSKWTVITSVKRKLYIKMKEVEYDIHHQCELSDR